MATTPPSNTLLNPNSGVSVFGKIVTAVRNLLSTETETQPLELAFGTDAEARGYGNSPFSPETQSLSSYAFEKMRLEAGRFAAIRDYELMDGEQPEVSAALDVIAEFSTQSDDPKAETFNIECEDEEFGQYLMEKAEFLKIDKMVTSTAREVAKYGCSFWELVVNDEGEFNKVKPLTTPTMIRNEDKFGVLMKEAFTQISPKTNQAVAHFAAWQVINGRYHRSHGRMYGSSLLEPARKVYKQLQMIEDGLVVGRLYRSHMRYIFQIPVDGMTADAAERYLTLKKTQFRKRSRYNTSSGKLEQSDSPISADEDFFMGVKKDGAPAKVETIQGQGGLADLGDVEYFQNKMLIALKVPKALLGLERDVNAKATLTEQAVNFARTLRRIQQVVGGMVQEALERAMILDGIDPEKAPEWAVVMPPVSTTDDLRQAQVEAIRANIAVIYGQKIPVVDKEFIYKQIMLLSQDEIERLMDLDPEEIGIQTMPSPPFENVGENEAELGNAAPGGGGSGGQQQQGDEQPPAGKSKKKPAAEQLALGDGTIDEKVVLTIRKQLNLPLDDAISEGELQLARELQEFGDRFGRFTVEEAVLQTAFTRAKHSKNGHGK